MEGKDIFVDFTIVGELNVDLQIRLWHRCRRRAESCRRWQCGSSAAMSSLMQP
jgi:hypothetical protein